jgi:hypothetical protein
VYDFDNKRVGLAPAIQIDAKKGLKPWVIAVIAVGGVMVIAIIAIVICKVKKQNK